MSQAGHAIGGMPQYVWRRHRILYFVLVPALVVGVTQFPIRGYLVTVATLALSVSAAAALLWSRRRIRMRMFAHACELCLVCAYSLRGLPAHGNCPECGAPYSKPDVLHTWKRWARA